MGRDDVWLTVVQQFPKYPHGAKPGAMAEAKARAGLPALEKKQYAAARAWRGAMDRFYDMPAHTLEGMIVKLTADWCYAYHRDWRARGAAAEFTFYDDATASVLMDLERLAGRVS